MASSHPLDPLTAHEWVTYVRRDRAITKRPYYVKRETGRPYFIGSASGKLKMSISYLNVEMLLGFGWRPEYPARVRVPEGL